MDQYSLGDEPGLIEAVEEVWGVSEQDCDFSPARALIRANPHLRQQRFRTRQEALGQIELARSRRRSPSSLSEAL